MKDCQLPIANCRFEDLRLLSAQRLFKNRQSAIGNWQLEMNLNG